MERDPLNFFEPFEGLPPGHENQLTRALLLVLRLSPIAHQAWLTRVLPDKPLWDLPPAEWVTQRREIIIEADPEEPVPLTSVFLSPGGAFDDTRVLAASDRGQVLDAIITYPGERVVVVENKVSPADDWQAANINVTGVAVSIGKGHKPVRVLWPDLLADFNGLLERNMVAGAERSIVSDFLVYVEDHFPGLGPDQTLKLCNGNPFRTARRLRWILSEALGVEAQIDGWGPRADILSYGGMGSRLYLIAGKDDVALSIYPADTITQARAFYADPMLVQGVRGLVATNGWYGRQNFHFGHMQTGFAWASGAIELDDYLGLWQAEIGETTSLRRNEWDQFFDWLLEKEIATPADRQEFDRHFTNTGRQTATPRPGLELGRSWPLAEALALDTGAGFSAQVAAAYEQIRAAFGA